MKKIVTVLSVILSLSLICTGCGSTDDSASADAAVDEANVNSVELYNLKSSMINAGYTFKIYADVDEDDDTYSYSEYVLALCTAKDNTQFLALCDTSAASADTVMYGTYTMEATKSEDERRVITSYTFDDAYTDTTYSVSLIKDGVNYLIADSESTHLATKLSAVDTLESLQSAIEIDTRRHISQYGS
jgi:hypothetical protein